ncbi:MAG: sulfotransferase [Sphingobium sp.]|nr:sulfotransferase [Sphingobium sp.]
MSDRDLAEVLKLVEQIQPALQRGDRITLNDIIRQLVAAHAPMGDQWEQLAQIAAGNGEHRLAMLAIDLFVDYWGGRPSAQFKKAAFLTLLNNWRDADVLFQTVPENVPDPVSNIYRKGSAALNLGRIDEARALFERLIRMRPTMGFAWSSLAMTVDFSREPELAERLIANAATADTGPLLQRIPYRYALGKAHADRGEHALAFEAFASGARLTRSTVDYDIQADRAAATRATEGYTADRIAALTSQQTEATGRTIFVTGLPRSGTTLVEQILTSHSAVSDGGETARLFLLADEVSGTDWHALARHVDAKGIASPARLWDYWLDELYPASGRIVDKTLEASRFLGLAAGLLPEAPLIWMTRDPLDCAWSCFRTSFAGTAIAWSNDLAEIAAHFRLEDELLARWQELLGDRLLVLPYEALVTDPATWIPRLLAHCGLLAEPQVFVPHENRRPVMTASMVQVRQPINRTAIGAAEPYREFLQPFIDAYYG